MKIKSIDFKNFASYGNIVQRLSFDENSKDLILVEGKNGQGKSTLAKVITYLLYGKIDNCNLKDLPNRINGNLWGRIVLESKGSIVDIERGISPNVLKVKINNVEYDVAGKSNIQDFLDSEIYEIPYQVFKNLIILSVNDFKSFITMSPADKKQIIDKIFGFSILNDMKNIVKLKRKETSDTLKICEKELSSIEDSIYDVNQKISNYKELLQQKNEKNKDEYNSKIEQINESLLKIKDMLSKVYEKESMLESKLSDAQSKAGSTRSDIKNIQKSLELYDNNCCPLCHAPLDDDFHLNMKHDYEEKLDDLISKYEKYSDGIKLIKEKHSEIKGKIETIVKKESELNQKKRGYQKEISNIENSSNINDNGLKNLNELIDNFKEKQKIKEEEKNATLVDNNYYSILEDILSDNGIKAMALKSILPFFNATVTNVCMELGISYNIKFDEQFDCIIKSMAQEISPKTLSTGEKKKLDFAIIISLLRMIKLRFPNLNLLFLDEIFSSIDMDGVNNIIKVLHDNIKDLNINAFVINHAPLPNEFFDKKIEIKKDAGFSKLEITELN